MKTNSRILLTSSLAVAFISPCFALEAPVDDAPPPPAAQPSGRALPEFKLAPQPNSAPKQATAFLGVISGDIPEILATHLDLVPGVGVVTRSLVPNGPAAKAGLMVNDVITHVADQKVGSPLAISNEIAKHKVGETISLNIIHKGKPAKLDVTLADRPAEFATADRQALQQLDLEAIPKELADRIRGTIAGDVGGVDLGNGNDHDQLPLEMKNAIAEMQKRMQGVIGGATLNSGDSKIIEQVQSEATVRMKDNQGSVEVKSKNGSREITVLDHQGHVVWSGPWNNVQDQAAAPGTIKERIDSLNIDSSYDGGGIRLKTHNQGAPDEE